MGNKLPTTIFTIILLLFVSGFAILFQVERRTMRTSYLLVTHITSDAFLILLSISINSETLPEFLFDFYYVQPDITKKKRDALNQKLAEAGKPSMK